jgi:hypothetical protein
MAKGSNQPKFKANPTINKNPKIASPLQSQSYMDKNPAWRISKMEVGDPFGWHILDENEIQFVRDKLKEFESMTWDQILIKAKKQNHSVSIDDLIKDAQRRLTEINLDDLDQLVSLHLSGRKRVWGYIVDQGVMNLLWWDPEHTICPSIKKHT